MAWSILFDFHLLEKKICFGKKVVWFDVVILIFSFYFYELGLLNDRYYGFVSKAKI